MLPETLLWRHVTADGVPQGLYKQVDRHSAELESRGAVEGIRELYMRTRNIQVGEILSCI